ncbi:MAG: inositol phosphorylceramide synthase [Flavobacteriales bacterium]|nr:inositol phosphorylceramide synthase [Flavobacteriales bacterium]
MNGVALDRGGQWIVQRLRVPVIASAIYLPLSAVLIGFKTDQLVLAALFTGLYMASAASRRWVLGFAIFFVYWVIFDWMKALPNYTVNTVHIGDLYAAERSLFGIAHQGTVLTPNEHLALRTTPLKDLLAGLFYLCWVPVPLAFAAYLYAKDKVHFLRFALCFLLVNLLGFAVYYLYPAAPPWYVAQHDTAFIAGTPGNTAGLGRFDALTGLPIFHGLYSKSSNVFAAVPSLHAAYLLVAAYWAHRAGLKKARAFFAFIAAGIWWAAVYSGHHYILDVLAGIACAVLGVTLFNLLLRAPRFAAWITRYRNAIEQPRRTLRPGPQLVHMDGGQRPGQGIIITTEHLDHVTTDH